MPRAAPAPDLAASAPSGAPSRTPSRTWRNILGTIAGVAALAWLFMDQDLGAMWRAVQQARPEWIVAVFPVLLIDMLFRAARWRTLLGRGPATGYASVFSALMVGYLANNVLPARVGDLIRVYILGQDGTMARSRILATVMVERILDLATIVLIFALAAAASPVPGWMKSGGLALAAATAAGAVGLLVASLYGELLLKLLLQPIRHRLPSIGDRLGVMGSEFVRGFACLHRPAVALSFFGLTAGIWLTEIAIILLVGQAFGLELGSRDAATLMLFSLFSSLIPALPGQFGTFEFAMTLGLEYLGHPTSTGLPFALALHLVLLLETSAIGAACLAASSGNLLAWRQASGRRGGP